MGSKRFDTVDDCARHGADVRISCTKCGNVGTMSARELSAAAIKLKKGPANRSLRAIGERCRCSKCGHRGALVTPGMGWLGPR